MRTAVVVFAVCALVACASTAWSKPGSAPGILGGANITEDSQTESGFGQVPFLAEEGYVVMQEHFAPYEWGDIVRFVHSLAQPGWTDIELISDTSSFWSGAVQAVNASPNKEFIPEGTDGLSVYWPDGVSGVCYSFQSDGDVYIPEPASITILGLGLLAMIRRRRAA